MSVEQGRWNYPEQFKYQRRKAGSHFQALEFIWDFSRQGHSFCHRATIFYLFMNILFILDQSAWSPPEPKPAETTQRGPVNRSKKMAGPILGPAISPIRERRKQVPMARSVAAPQALPVRQNQRPYLLRQQRQRSLPGQRSNAQNPPQRQ